MMTRDEARAFRERWRRVNQAEIEELRRTPVEVKLQQLAVLMDAAREFGWQTQTPEEEDRVRRLWIRLRERYRG